MTRDQTDAAENEVGATVDAEGKGSLDVTLDEGFGVGSTGQVRRRLSTGTLIMGGVLVIAGLSLWSMRAIDRAAASGPSTSNEIEKLFDDALKSSSRVGAKVDTDASRLLEPTEAANEVQVPLKDLAEKDPFIIWRDGSGKPKPDKPVGDSPGSTIGERVADWENKVDGAAQAIKVQSTMAGIGDQGAVGIANVNGHMMRAGDLFAVDKTEVEFTVDRIERNEVTFRAYNPELRHERLVIVKVNRKF